MTKIIYILVVGTIFFSSCRSAFEFASLQPKGGLSSKLPSLEPITFISTLENAYSKGQSYSVGSAYSFGKNRSAVSVGSALTTYFTDKRVNDALVIFERDVKDNITNYIGEKKGSISFKITNSSYVLKHKRFTHILAFGGTAALLGIALEPTMEASDDPGVQMSSAAAITVIPALIYAAIIKPKAIQNIEIEVEILNLQEKVIGRYTGIGVGVYKSNMYTFPKDVNRIVNAEAIKNALQEIKTKIDIDSNKLINELK